MPVIWNTGQAETIESLSDEQIVELGFSTPVQIQQMAQSSPGSYWYIFGEANRFGYITGTRFAPVFHYFLENILLGDPTAKIIGTSILNWDFICIGCGGYQSGKSWLTDFISSYEARYGEKPPVDVWAIDAYPIDWHNTPNNDPGNLAFYDGDTVLHSHIVTQQLQRMRQYLNTNGYENTPIWITEIAIHVGYGYGLNDRDGWEWVEYPTKMAPQGPYHWDLMGNYLIEIFDWLETNAESNKIEKWFFFSTWDDIENVGPDGYMGITFFDSKDVGASLNCLGEIFRTRSLGLPPVKCDGNGVTVSAN
mgnify:CR=1 FL=1